MDNLKTYNDHKLLTLLKKGSHSAYTEIHNRYFELMFIFAFKKLKDEDLSKDFVQDLFVNLWNKRETLSENGKLSSYLYISIRSRIFDYFAHQKVQIKYLDFLKNYQLKTNEPTDHLIREKELDRYIEQEILRLPKKMRQVFELSRKENLSHTEIAERLEITENNVSQHLSNALKIFRIKLGKIIPLLFYFF
ncbi:RNA polymerase sigma-70 factor [Pedobacter sp. G11]|uniref:RNA polymerase sigma factor n=1 Tax=Pedobacter sp. G11 TaxID=2482728 RepID=UPI000F5E5E93|nr:RNA polymerase sigma-70 factor [Pedobacter sp. G11]AZI24144.1 RNA polymerase sigma-70 factor [Pedobacter sp. G11]